MAKICKLDYKRHKYEDAGLLSCPLSWNEKLVEDDETHDLLECFYLPKANFRDVI